MFYTFLEELRMCNKIRHLYTVPLLAVVRPGVLQNDDEALVANPMHNLLRHSGVSCVKTVSYVGYAMPAMRCSMRDFEKEGKKITIQQFSTIFYRIACALDYMHTVLRVVHRDLKPGNILLDEDNNSFLCDFGQAMDLEKRGDGYVFLIGPQEGKGGTPGYRPKEQSSETNRTSSNISVLDATVDIHALGYTIYDMLPCLDVCPRAFKPHSIQGRIEDVIAVGYLPSNLPASLDLSITTRGRGKEARVRPGNECDISPSFRSIACLVRHMVSPVPSKRPSASSVAKVLADM